MAKYERQPTGIAAKDLKAAFAHAEAEYPNECCGVFTRSSGYVRCTNVHAQPKTCFAIKEWVQVIANADDVIAVFHSHSDGSCYPSAVDMEHQLSTSLCWGVAVLNGLGLVHDCFFWGSDNIPPLLGREYRSGAMDCYSLIRDAYKLWYGIDLKEFPRDKQFWDAGKKLYTDGYKEAGFVEIPKEQLVPGDVLIGSVLGKGIVNHGGLLLDEQTILHHPSGTLSRRSDLTRWFKHLNICLRHKSFKDLPPRPPKLELSL